MIRVAIVGTGNIANMHVAGLLTFPDRCQIVALCDIYPEKAEGTISKMKFRILNENIGRPHEMRMLGMAVEKEDGTWELHQIELTIAGDLKEDSVKKFAGFGAIKDFCFSFRNTASN